MILTARLRLRPPRVADFERYLPLFQQPETGAGTQFMLSTEDAWSRLLRFVGHWAHFGYGLFIVEELATGELVAEVGCARFRRGIDARFDAVPEAAWRVLASQRGRGIATESMQAVLEWLDRMLRAPRTVCMVNSGNAPSRKVAAKLGYAQFGKARYKKQEVVLLERARAAV